MLEFGVLSLSQILAVFVCLAVYFIAVGFELAYEREKSHLIHYVTFFA